MGGGGGRDNVCSERTRNVFDCAQDIDFYFSSSLPALYSLMQRVLSCFLLNPAAATNMLLKCERYPDFSICPLPPHFPSSPPLSSSYSDTFIFVVAGNVPAVPRWGGCAEPTT